MTYFKFSWEHLNRPCKKTLQGELTIYFLLRYWHLVSIVYIITLHYLSAAPEGMHCLQTGDFAGTLIKLHSNIFREKNASNLQKTNPNKRRHLSTRKPSRTQKVFSAYVTAVATLTCRVVISVITLCNHSFSMGRESGGKTALVLAGTNLQQQQQRVTRSGSGQSISFLG